MRTSAPIMTPPEGSRTMPLTVPFGDCAVAIFINRTNVMKHRTISLTRTRHLLEGSACTHSPRFRRSSRSCTNAPPLKGANDYLSSGDGPACYGWFGFTFRYAKRKGLPLGLWLPPSGSAVTKTASIWASFCGSSNFKTQRFFETLSS